jgi:hypothetical protein
MIPSSIVIAACMAKHLKFLLAFKKDWNNKVIAQFYATVYFEEHGDTRKLHWMTKGEMMLAVPGFIWLSSLM